MVGVAHKRETGLGPHRVHPPGEGLVGHIVFHDVDQRLVRCLLSTGEFIKGHDIPVADKANAPVRVVHEELRDRHLATRNQLTMRRKLRIDVRLARPLGAKLDDVIVPFHEGDQAHQLQELRPTPKGLRVEPDALHQ